MQTDLRGIFNAGFTESAYNNFLNTIDSAAYYPSDFRIAETPLFLTDEFTVELIQAAYNLAGQVSTNDFLNKSTEAIPADFNVPGKNGRPVFLQIDFAICRDENNNYTPRLVELQGFASLYCFQHILAKYYKKHFNIPEDFTNYFSNLNEESYVKLLKDAIVGNSAPENVILLEIEPEHQKTRIDFALTENLIGVKPVCITKIIKKDKRLYYYSGNKEIRIDRIYNRVIFDELKRKNLHTSFSFTDELDVTWVGHPNWFFRISKHSLPMLKGKYVPECFYLHEISTYPADLENFVLKPLYSFAGTGVEVDVTKEMLDNISDRNNYILQRKIEYAPFLPTPDGYAKAEIRMMFVWPENQEKPVLVNNLTRLSKGKMMGVAFNKNRTWVGSSVALHRKTY